MHFLKPPFVTGKVFSRPATDLAVFGINLIEPMGANGGIIEHDDRWTSRDSGCQW
jgi:hypothetical protein